jgi:hypothetical protein
MGIWARSPQPNLLPEEEEVFHMLRDRTARVLDDMQLQEDVFVALEGVMRETAAVLDEPEARLDYGIPIPRSRQEHDITNQPDFVDLVRDALKDYWGGPRLTAKPLLQLNVVKSKLDENEGNPARAVRAVLTNAMEKLKPEGQRSMTMTEWVLYNIVELRFVQGKKVLDVARRLAMSEADLYRKQKYAINQVAQNIAEMERETETPHDGDTGSAAMV